MRDASALWRGKAQMSWVLCVIFVTELRKRVVCQQMRPGSASLSDVNNLRIHLTPVMRTYRVVGARGRKNGLHGFCPQGLSKLPGH